LRIKPPTQEPLERKPQRYWIDLKNAKWTLKTKSKKLKLRDKYRFKIINTYAKKLHVILNKFYRKKEKASGHS
jgi:hypothetical protein